MGTHTSLYETDFLTWTQQQAALLREGKFHDLDVANVAEEIESLGRSEWRALESRLDVLVRHLLKWCYQTAKRSPSWQRTIMEQRRRVRRLLRANPPMRSHVGRLIAEEYASIRRQAATETRLPLVTFPETCPWTAEQIRDEDFWPDAPP